MSVTLPLNYPLTLSRRPYLRYAVFFYLYAMQGIPAGFYTTALPNYFAAEGVESGVIGSFVAIIGIPWAFQFVWGPLIDRFQNSMMGRRKPWVVGAQLLALLASAILLSVQNPIGQIGMLGWLFLVRSLFAAVQDASVDAMAISIIPKNERGRLNSFMRSGYLVGYGGGAALFSQVLREHGFHSAVLLMVLCLSTGAVLMLFVRERPNDHLLPAFADSDKHPASGALPTEQESDEESRPEYDFKWLFRELFHGLFARRSLLLFGAIVLAYTSIALFSRAYNYHLIRSLGWRDTDLSVLTGTYGMLVAILISLVGGYLADRIGPRRMLLVVLLIVAAYLIGFNLLSEQWANRGFARTGLITLTFMDPSISVTAIPVLMSICRKGVEGSQFTTYMAFVNLCDLLGTFLSGKAQMVVSAPVIGLVAGGMALTAMFVAGLTLRHYRGTETS